MNIYINVKGQTINCIHKSWISILIWYILQFKLAFYTFLMLCAKMYSTWPIEVILFYIYGIAIKLVLFYRRFKDMQSNPKMDLAQAAEQQSNSFSKKTFPLTCYTVDDEYL